VAASWEKLVPRGGPTGAPAGQPAAIALLLSERQALLAGPNTPQALARIEALGLRVAELLEQIAGVQPPEALLDDQASTPGEFDRFLGRDRPERRAG
jgi:hypothetical protein